MDEKEILKFWQENKIFEKSLEKESPKGEFVFYDGPPFATGLPHFGHLLPTSIKDAIPRYKTMRGYHVNRRWGWDCHGLPVENLAEKELGLKTKKDIEDLGVEKFNTIARASVLRFTADWKRIIPRLGRWVDMENNYETMGTNYSESVWWAFKTLYNKGLIYEGFKSMHICPRCETTLSNFEVNQGYKDITDISVTVKFELKDEPGTFFLAWTTTPWTLPGNVALAVGKEIIYTKVRSEETNYILAKNRVKYVFKDKKFEILEEFNSEKIVGKSYKPIFGYYDNEKLKNRENGFKIYGADFVGAEDGTGIVHIAPAFGEDDMNLGRAENLPFIQHVGADGKFKKEVVDFVGEAVKPKEDNQRADIFIIKYLANKGLLFSKEKIIHSYPFCWRCDTPLLNYAASSWFVKVSAIKDKIVAENQKVNWIPKEIGSARFGKWLEGARDWAISRSRYWGAPIPVWKCDKCGHAEVLGSVEDIKKKTKSRNKYFVMRHGEADNNVKAVISSEVFNSSHLTEKGKVQAAKSAEKLKRRGIDIIFSSPFIRTKETAFIVAEKLGIKKEDVVFDERLQELKAGLFDGKSVSEYTSYFTSEEERFTKNPPQGENYADIKKRVTDFIYNIDKKYAGKTILIVTHDSPAWLLFSGAAGMNVKEALDFRGDGELFIENAQVRELEFSPLPHNENYELDLHRPYIDEIKFPCEKCDGVMKRIAEVFDCWFESGSMPYAESHYPFENLDKFNPQGGFLKKSRGFPSDFIAEGLDQTRGWFYSMLVLSVALFGRAAYKNVIVNGMVLAEDGQKMSKHLNNFPDLMETVLKYGADPMRFYLLSSPVVRAEEIRFSEKGVDEVVKKNFTRLNNIHSFYSLYEDGSAQIKGEIASQNILDKWIIAKLYELSTEVTDAMERYEIDKAMRPIADFIDDLSTWYIRRSRERFKSENLSDKKNALETTRFVLNEFSKIIAPFIPFTAEDLYQKINHDGFGKESVHLEDWPKPTSHVGFGYKYRMSVLEEMKEVRKIVSLGLEARAKVGVKVRQPLKSLKVKSQKSKAKITEELLELVKDELNVKEVVFDDKISGEVELDTVITPDLKEEGDFRELVRALQDMRKKAGLIPAQKIILQIQTDAIGQKFLQKFDSELKKSVGAKEIKLAENLEGEEIKAGEMGFKIKIT